MKKINKYTNGMFSKGIISKNHKNPTNLHIEKILTRKKDGNLISIEKLRFDWTEIARNVRKDLHSIVKIDLKDYNKNKIISLNKLLKDFNFKKISSEERKETKKAKLDKINFSIIHDILVNSIYSTEDRRKKQIREDMKHEEDIKKMSMHLTELKNANKIRHYKSGSQFKIVVVRENEKGVLYDFLTSFHRESLTVLKKTIDEMAKKYSEYKEEKFHHISLFDSKDNLLLIKEI